jgi:homoserine dehydrogenase
MTDGVAVVSDVLSVVGRRDTESQRAGAVEVPPGARRLRRPHYVRFTVSDKPGILAQVTTSYAKYGINIEGVLQLPKFRKDRLPFVTTLEECPESVLERALAEVAQSDYHVVPPLSLPIFT